MGLLKASGKRLTGFGQAVMKKIYDNNGTVILVAKLGFSAAFVTPFVYFSKEP